MLTDNERKIRQLKIAIQDRDEKIARLTAKLHRVEQWVIDDMLADQKRRIKEAVEKECRHLGLIRPDYVLATIDKACEVK